MDLPRGYFGKVLALDCETSGINYNAFGIDVATGYQSVSWGFVVADGSTLKPIDELYIEIKYDGVSKWDAGAEKIHGLSQEYLAANGMTNEEAVEEIVNFVVKHWNPDADTSSERNVRCLGQNVATFDIWFLIKLFEDAGATELRNDIFRTGNRFIDTSSIGYVMGCYNSDDLFDMVGVHRGDHNALEDAHASLTAVRTAKKMYNLLLSE
jgi:oligoribonuclease (3'-5' exoribonuclease)